MSDLIKFGNDVYINIDMISSFYMFECDDGQFIVKISMSNYEIYLTEPTTRYNALQYMKSIAELNDPSIKINTDYEDRLEKISNIPIDVNMTVE